jgi:hypothetical protein
MAHKSVQPKQTIAIEGAIEHATFRRVAGIVPQLPLESRRAWESQFVDFQCAARKFADIEVKWPDIE